MFSCGEIVIVKDFFDDADNVLCKIVGIGATSQRTHIATSLIVQPLNKIGEWKCYNVHITDIKKQDNNK